MRGFPAKFLNRDLSVAIAGKASTDNQLWGQGLKAAGFTRIHRVSGIKAVLDLMEQERVDWVLCPLFWEVEGANAYHLLRACVRFPELRHVAVTVSLTPLEAQDHPAWLAGGGALNWLVGCTQGDRFATEIQAMDSRFEQHMNFPGLVSLEYLWPFLDSHDQYGAMIRLTRGLLKRDAGNPTVLAYLADALALDDQQDEAAQIAHQLGQLHPEKVGVVQELRKNHDLPEASGSESGIFADRRLSIFTTSLNLGERLKRFANGLGIECQTFDNPQSLLDSLKSNPEQLVICQWDDSDDNGNTHSEQHGSMVIQRVRDSGFYEPLIAVVGEGLSEMEEVLLREMGIFFSIETDCDEAGLLKTCVSMMQVDTSGYNARVLLHKIRQSLHRKNRDEAVLHYTLLEGIEEVDPGLVVTAEGEISYFDGEFEEAKDMALQALNLPGDAVTSLNLLGKALMSLGEFDLAFNCFDSAQAVSPLNLSRLSRMAEAKVALDDFDSAQKIVDQGRAMDRTNPAINEAATKLAIASGDTEQATELLAGMSEISSVVSFMNNKAVAASQEGRFDEAVTLYSQAIESLPKKHRRYASVIYYNKALMFLRRSELDPALEFLGKIKADHNPNIHKKAAKLITTVKKAKAAKKSIKFAPAKSAAGDVNKKSIKQKLQFSVNQMDIQPGERFLYNIYAAAEELEIDGFLDKTSKDLPFKEKVETIVEGKKIWN